MLNLLLLVWSLEIDHSPQRLREISRFYDIPEHIPETWLRRTIIRRFIDAGAQSDSIIQMSGRIVSGAIHRHSVSRLTLIRWALNACALSEDRPLVSATDEREQLKHISGFFADRAADHLGIPRERLLEHARPDHDDQLVTILNEANLAADEELCRLAFAVVAEVVPDPNLRHIPMPWKGGGAPLSVEPEGDDDSLAHYLPAPPPRAEPEGPDESVDHVSPAEAPSASTVPWSIEIDHDDEVKLSVDVDDDLNEFLELTRPQAHRDLNISQILEGQAEAQDPPRGADREISIWVSDETGHCDSVLQLGVTYTLNFKVGSYVEASLVKGQPTLVASADVPHEGLQTDWTITSQTIELLPESRVTTVEQSMDTEGTAWTARFELFVPFLGETLTHQIGIKPRQTGPARIDVLIYVGREVYRQLVVEFSVGESENSGLASSHAGIAQDHTHAPFTQLQLAPPHEWTTPPGEIVISVLGPVAHVRGDAGNEWVPGSVVPWEGVQASVAGKIKNVVASAERFRAIHEKYLNDIAPDDLANRLKNWQPEYNWDALSSRASELHSQNWSNVERSSELRDLAYDGRKLFDAFFPPGSKLQQWVRRLYLGQRLDIVWTREYNPGWISHVPWGLMYLGDVPALGEPIDPVNFLGLRFRIGYTAHAVPEATKDLGRLDATHRVHFLYWGHDPLDLTAKEARWQRDQWKGIQNQIFVPTTVPDPDSKTELLRQLNEPEPAPTAVLYLFCECAVGDGNDPVLRFGGTRQAVDNVRRTELATKLLNDRPLVFANACTTSASDPYFANELEEGFFDRGCRAYLGTETKVPIEFASRFASIFFHFFYRAAAPEPMAAGEALVQTRLMLWTHYRNIGGLFYSYINQYEVFMAEDAEVRAMRA